jgi:hypothetical protein
MFVSLRTLTLPAERAGEAANLAAQLRLAAAALPGASNSWAGPSDARLTLNAGHLAWRTEFASEKAAIEAPLSPEWQHGVVPLLVGTRGSALGYQVTRRGLRGSGAGIWRALVFRVWPQGYPEGVKQLEACLLLMPKYIGTIRSWALSTVQICEGPKAFTHVWEQEFDSAEGLTGEYMDHPIHWGVVDSFFDAELPQYIVDPHLLQIVGQIDGPVIA